MAVTQTLSVLEVAEGTDYEANTSQVRIIWQSIQTGESYNEYTRTAYYYVTINGGTEKKYTVSYTLPRGSTVKIVDTIITVPHRDDGTADIVVRTWMDTEISAGTISKTSGTVPLAVIPRASTLNHIYKINLGNRLSCDWIPLSASFRYRVKFSTKTWSYTTGIIHPNRTSNYTWQSPESVKLPYSIANEFPNDDEGNMSVTLYTYSDSAGNTQVGSESTKTFTVYLLEGEALPSVTITPSPVTPYEGLESVYLQGRSRVQASFTGSGQYGATIKSYSMKIGTKTYSSPYLSDILSTSGDITIEGTAIDSRGRPGKTTKTITVFPYSKPSIIPYTGASSIICKRCLSDGTPDAGGTYLLIKMGRKYAKVTSGGTQLNHCTLSYRYKTDSQAINQYSDPKVILSGTASTDYVSVIIPNVVTSNTTAYNIQLIAEDDCGENDIVTITIPTMFVTVHIPEGGHGLTLGGYHDPSKTDVFDCKFDAEFHGVVSGSVLGLLGSSGNVPSDGDLNDYRVPGVYAIPSNAYAQTIKNMPLPYAGLLRVYASTGQTKVTEGNWINLIQEYRSYDASTPEYRRRVTTDGNGVWSYGGWVLGIDGAVHLAGRATQVNANIYTENGVETCQFAIRAGDDIYVLNCSTTGIVYGKNGKVLWSK